jgi:replicative DNA helicase
MERNVVTCILNNPELLNSVDLPTAAFESKDLRVAYSFIKELRDAGHEEVSINTLRHFYDARVDFQTTVSEHGGWKFLETLGLKPDFTNYKLHLVELENRHAMRTMTAALDVAIEKVKSGGMKSCGDILSAVDEALAPSTAKVKEGEQITPGMINRGWLKKQSERFKRGEFKNVGIEIFHPLDQMCGRKWSHGSLNVWAGETNVGKSFLVQMLVGEFCIDRGIPTLILDNEMSDKQYYDRLIARATGLSSYKFQDGTAYDPDSADYAVVESYMDKIEAAPMTWVEFYELKIHKIEALVRNFLRKYPVDKYPNKMLIVDGLKLDGDSDSFWSVGFLAQNLKLMTRKYGREGLVTHVTTQLNRGGASKARGKDGDSHPTHLDVGLSKLIPDNADDFYLLLHHFEKDADDNKLFDKVHRRGVCTKARDHQTLEGQEYLLFDFKGDIGMLRPVKLSKGPVSPGAGALPDDLNPTAGM